MQNCLSAKFVQLLIRKISLIAAYQAYYYPQESTSTLGNGSLIPPFFFTTLSNPEIILKLNIHVIINEIS